MKYGLADLYTGPAAHYQTQTLGMPNNQSIGSAQERFLYQQEKILSQHDRRNAAQQKQETLNA